MVRSLHVLLFTSLSIIFSITASGQCDTIIDAFPWEESFEDGFTNWTGDIANPGWQLTDASGPNGTPSVETGPTSIIDGTLAAYTEVTGGGGSPGVIMDLNGPCIALPQNSIPFFAFAYHMYNETTLEDAMGSLAIQINDDPENDTVWTTVWSDTGNQGNVWIPDTVDLSAYIGDTIQLRFRSVSGTAVDSNWQGDRAIDRLHLSLGVEVVDNYCQGGSAGSASISPNFGTAPYTYLWSTGETTSSISDLPQGNYSVTVTDALAASLTTTFTVLDGQIPVISGLPYNQSWENNIDDWSNSSNDDFDWTFRSNGIGGTGPTVPDFPSDGSVYIYTESSGQSAGDLAILNSPCFHFESSTLPYLIFDYQMKVDGGGGSSANMGWLYLVADTTPTTLNDGDTIWQQFGDQGTNWITDTADISDYAGSELVLRFVGEIGITIPQYGDRAIDNLRFSDAISVSESCDGGSGGSIVVTPVHGAGPYTYLWSNASVNSGITNLAAGTYTVTITDANLETVVRTVTVDTLSIPAPTGLSATTSSFCINELDSTQLKIDVIEGDAFYFGSTAVLSDLGTPFTIGETVIFPLTGAPNTPTSDATIAFYSRGDLEAPGEFINTFSENGELLSQALDHSAQCGAFYEVDGFSIPLDTVISWTQDDTIFFEAVPVGMTRYCGTGGQRYSMEGYYTISYEYSTTKPYWFENSCDTVLANAIDSGFVVNVSPTTTTTYYVRYYNNACQAWGECDSITITVNPVPSVSVTPNPASYCNQLPTTLTATGASSYLWTPGTGLGVDTGSVVTTTSSNALTYSVIGTDGNGCKDTATVALQITAPPSVNFANTPVTCNGGSDGQSIANVSGGTAPYSYQWSTGASVSNISGLSATTYTVTVTDSLGCASSNATTVTEPGAVQVFAFANPVTCNGLSSGSFFANVTGGTSPYDFEWSSGQTTLNSTFSFVGGQSAGTYTVTVTDQLGCEGTDSVQVIEPDPLVIDSITVINVSCNGGNDASASAFVSGGTSPYSYSWSPGSLTGQTVNGLSAGTYTLNLTDNNGCFISTTVTITEPTILVVNAIAAAPVSCNGGNDGSATASASGGTPGYTYLWDNNETTATALSLTSGQHCVTITDSNGCSDTACAVITEPTAISASLVETNVSCFGGNDGAIAATGSGGNGAPYTYAWSNGDTTSSTGTLIAGTYALTVTDNNGCSDTFSTTVTEPDSMSFAFTEVDVLCNAEATGSASVSVTGGTAGYTYLWSNGGTTAGIASLVAATYTVTVTDANGCEKSASVTITEPTPITLSIASFTNVSCASGNDGSASVTAIGGNSPYTYNWTSGSLTATASALSAGTYTVTVTDANSCSDTISVIITEPTALVLTPQVNANVSCNGGNDGETEVSVAGGTAGYTYLWSSGSTTATASSLIAGTYTVIVTDANGCTETANATITEPTPILVSTSVDSIPSCAGDANGGVSAGASGGTGTLTFLWNTGSTNAALSGVSAATYTVVVTDANGCTATDSIVLTEPVEMIATFSNIDSISCNGVIDGGLFATGTGGTAPYTYLWSTGSTADNITGLSDGTYTVSITDANGCFDDTATTLISPAIVALTIDSTNDVNCFGGADGEAYGSGVGGTLPYTFAWSNGSFGSSINDLTEGNHSVTLTDANGCLDTGSFSIGEPASALSISASVDSNASCFGFSDGGASSSASGGTAPYAFSWSNGGTANSTNGLAAGIHTIVITDANGCSDSTTVTITEPTQVVASIALDSNVSCNAGSNGALTASAIGGTGGYDYLWSNNATSASISGLSAGSYTVTVTDASGCIGTMTMSITEPTLLSASIVNDSNATCNSGSNGGLSASGSGGTSPYSFLWSNGATGSANSGISAGTYTVTITDANGCTSTASETITEPTPVLAAIDSTQNVDCFGAASGAIFASASGGNGSYSYLWSSGQTSATISSLSAGTYTLTATDINGCTGTVQATITQPVSGIVLTPSVDSNASCNGAADGVASVSAAGGTAPYSYNWTSGSTSITTNGLTAGAYTVVVTDANGCSESASVTITEPTILLASVSVDSNAACFGDANGGVSASASGGTPSYTYLWSNNETTYSITGLSSGTYTVTITDANGCFDTASIVVTEPTLLLASALLDSNVACNSEANGAATAVASGGTTPYSYLWSNGASADTITNLAAGTYTVTVTDGNGCTESASVTITEPAQLVAAAVVDSNASCSGFADGGGSASATGGTSPYTFLWSDNVIGSVNSGIDAGTYTVTVTDANGCEDIASITITEPTLLVASSLLDSNASCNGAADGGATASALGGTAPYTYLWSDNQVTASATGLMAGTYAVTVTDANGCTDTSAVTVTEPVLLVASTVVDSNASCNGFADGGASASATGGTSPYTFLWSNNDAGTSADTLSSGTYTVTVTDANGCQDTATVLITEPVVLVAAAQVDSNASCNGATDGGTTGSATGGTSPYSYLWSDGQLNATAVGLGAGTYTVTVTDAQGCFDIASITITEPAVLVAATAVDSNTLCNGSSEGGATASATGGTSPFTYLWSDNQVGASAINLAAGTYTVTVTDANGCTDSETVVITEPTQVAASIALDSNVSCNTFSDGGATASAIGGTGSYTYLWSDNQITASAVGLATGTYTVTVTDANGCEDTASIFISEPTVLVASTVVDSNAACYESLDGGASAIATGGTSPYSYLWSSGSTSVSADGLGAGTHTVTITDANGCEDIATVLLTQPDTISIPPIVTNVSCFGAQDGKITTSVFGGTPNYSYAWSTGSANDSITGLDVGTYTVTVTDANACTNTESFTISQPTALSVSISGTTNVLCSGDSTGTIKALASGGTSGYTFAWPSSVSSLIDSAFNVPAGTFTVTVTDANGCTETADATITEPTPIVIASSSVTMVTCIGGSDGEIQVNATGGAGSFTYLWDNATVGATNSNLAVGEHCVTVTDGNGCQDSLCVTLIEMNALPIVDLGNDTIFCQQNFTVSAGSFAGYLWSTGSSAGSIIVDSTDDYSVTVTDANGCENTDTVSITMLDLPEASVTIIDSADCGINNGIAIANLLSAGGGGPYTYLWSNGQNGGPGITGLGFGNYQLTVTDVNSCADIHSFQMVEDTVILATISATDVTCFGAMDGSAAVTGLNGTMPYSYSWNSGDTTAALTNVGPGNYSVTLTDDNGCQAIRDTVVTEPLQILLTTSATEATCGGTNGSASVSAGPGSYTFTYLWSDPGAQTTSTATGLAAGLYTVTVTNQFFCTETATVSVNNLGAPTLTPGFTDELCVGSETGTAFVQAVGNGMLTYAWNDALSQTTDTASNLAAGTYGVTVTDVNGCNSFASITVGSTFSNPVISLGPDATVCGVSVPLSPGSGFANYAWSNSGTTDTISALVSGDYSVTVTDGNGCQASDTVNVTLFSPVLFTSFISDANCNDTNGLASVTVVNGGGGYTYEWSTGSTVPNIFNQPAGNYGVTITDANACTASDIITIGLVGAPDITLTSQDASCNSFNDGSALAAATGGNAPYSYAWSNGSTTDSAVLLTAATYTVTVTDDSNCAVTATVIISEPAKIILSVSTVSSSCGVNDGEASVSATGGVGSLSYLWNDPSSQTTPTAANLSAGIYVIVVTDATGCSNAANVPLNDNGAPLLITSAEDANCSNSADGEASVQAIGMGSYSYLWDDALAQANDTAFNLLPGTYGVTVTDTNGCIGVATSDVDFLDEAPFVSLGPDIEACENQEIILTPGGGYSSYAWSTGSTATDISVTASGNYSVLISTPNGCSAADTVDVQIVPTPVVDLGPDSLVCADSDFGGSFTLDAGAGFDTYAWSTGESTQSILVDSTGIYIVTVTTAEGCIGTDGMIAVFDTCINVTTEDFAGDRFQMQLYPNPNRGQFAIELSGFENGRYEMSITSIQGQPVLSRTISLDGSDVYREEVSLENVAAGMYILRLAGDKKLVERRVIIH